MLKLICRLNNLTKIEIDVPVEFVNVASANEETAAAATDCDDLVGETTEVVDRVNDVVVVQCACNCYI